MNPRDLLKPSLNWLLVCVPVAVVLNYAKPEWGTATFVFCCLSVIPLAGWMGKATEHLAERTGEAVGGLLNATFGNAAELIIAIVALRSGMIEIVKASLTGSIIGNILLVLGASFLAGGLKFKEQKFNAAGARMQSTLLTLAAIALIAPAAFHHTASAEGLPQEGPLSVAISIVLLVAYGLGLLFSLKTHKHMFIGHRAADSSGTDGSSEDGSSTDGSGKENSDKENSHNAHQEVWPVKVAFTVLAIATALIAWVSEILVHNVQHAADEFGMNQVFIGVIVVAVIGNAAEHSTAILMALKNRMDLSLSIAIGSSIQIALFVAPLLVLLSYVIAPTPMNLVFTLPEVIAVALAVAITGQIAGDGESNWLEGVLLLAVYIILGIVFYFLPVAG
jgi:Ca2+:H+ antiporter